MAFHLKGWRQAHITGPYPEALLKNLSDGGISFWNFQKTGDMEATFCIDGKYKEQVEGMGKGYLVEWEPIKGVYPGARRMRLRLLLPVTLCMISLLVFYLQSRVWFITVQGNASIPGEVILRTLEECGVGMGTAGFDLYEVKNYLLSRIPELSWCTINREGPLAEVVVRERTGEEMEEEEEVPVNLVAGLSGVVESVTVLDGTAQVKPGDVVQEGSVLISGFTDLERTILVTGASGEVMARTWREVDCVLPKNRLEKSYTGKIRRLISLEIGKKTINFYKSSGISYHEYDKMKVENPLTLPGGYVLPVSLNITTLAEYESVPAVEVMAEEILSDSIQTQVLHQLLAGVILDVEQTMKEGQESYCISSVVECREEIGRAVKIWNEGS